MSTPVILDEDTYTEAISFIIERDFFPNLAKMKAQQNYMEAQQSGTLSDFQNASKALRDLNKPKKGMNIYIKKELMYRIPFERAVYPTVANSFFLKKIEKNSDQSVNYYFEQEPELRDRVNLDLSLDQFQTLYTR